MPAVVGYARLSTAEQASGLTLEQQVARLKSAGAGDVLVDLMSGTSEARPRYRELLRRVQAGTVEKVIATRWDRLTRGAAETCRLVDVFSADGAPELHLLDDDLNLSTIGGRLQLRLLGVVAQAEVERIRERSAAGKAHRQAKGLVDVAPWGMRQVNGQLQLDREPFLCLLADRRERSPADLVLEMIGLLEQTLSFQTPWRHLGETYGLWKNRGSVQRLLINPALRGAKVGKRCKNLAVPTWADVVEGAGGEALVDPERHRALEARIRGAQARRSSPDKRRQHVLSGKVVCGHCGKLMGRFNRSGGTAGFRCLNEDCAWRVAGTRRNSISESVLIAAAFQTMHDRADDLAAMAERQAQQQDDAAAAQPEVQKLQAKRQRYLELMADGDAPELQGAVKTLDQQIAALIEAGTNWGEIGMPKIDALRHDAIECLKLDKHLGLVDPGTKPSPPETAVADDFRRMYGHMAQMEWDAKTIESRLYRRIPVIRWPGGEVIEEPPNPFQRTLRELIQELRVKERTVVAVTLNV